MDHEVAHIKFTNFASLQKIKTRLQQELVNHIEDERVEKLIRNELPGTRTNLDAINKKYMSIHEETRATGKMPWLQRIILSIRSDYAERDIVIEDDIQQIYSSLAPLIQKLKKTEGTDDVRKQCYKIATFIEKAKNEINKQGADTSLADEATLLGNEKESLKKAREAIEEALASNPLSTVTEHFNKEIAKLASSSQKKYDILTTRFDEEINHSGTGNPINYSTMRAKVKPLVVRMQRELERILKVRENAKWRLDRDRGALNTVALSKMASNKNYREVFKDFSKAETNNVAIQILIDESGSMANQDRIGTAKLAVTALAEALKNLGIAFEVTGFHSQHSPQLDEFRCALHENGENIDSFFRVSEVFVGEIYKNFKDQSLTGITKINSKGMNPDGEAVRWAAKRLSKQKQQRKILIVISDGLPMAEDVHELSWKTYGLLYTDLKDAISEVEKFGIETVAFGIQTDAVKQFYKDYIIVNNLQELPTVCMKKLAKIITRSL